jgi:monovalent cation:proton antiporter-2 (CPA2) family protein
MEHSLLTNAVLYLAAALVAVTVFHRLGLGAILGYLCAGALLGPQVSGLITDPEHTLHFAEFGVVMMLFVIGLELNPEKLWQMRRHILVLGGGQLLLSAVLIAAILLVVLHYSAGLAILLGLTLALSSTAFAIQLMEEQGIMGMSLGRKGFAILLLQDLAVIPILLLVGLLAPAQEDGGGQPWWMGPLAVVFALAIGRFANNPFLRAIAESGIRELFSAAALLIVLGTALLMQASGLTMGMGAFLAGIILGNSSFRHQLEADIEPFKGLLLGLFFIAVGMGLDLALLMREPWLILGAALALMLFKTAVISLLVRASRCKWRDALLLGLILSQGGEFAFVVLGKALDLNLLSADDSSRVNLIVGLSMALTAPLVMLFKRAVRTQPNETPRNQDQIQNDEPEVIIAGFGRFGQIVGRLLAANQLKFTALDKNVEHVEFVKRFGNKVFYGDATRPDLLIAAGIAHARIFVLAVDNKEDSVTIARHLRQHYPETLLIARSRDRAHAYQLLDLGVKHIIRETLESSLLAASYTLENLGYTQAQTANMVDIFRAHDHKMLLQTAKHQNDLEEMIKIATQGRKELESLFKGDNR